MEKEMIKLEDIVSEMDTRLYEEMKKEKEKEQYRLDSYFEGYEKGLDMANKKLLRILNKKREQE